MRAEPGGTPLEVPLEPGFECLGGRRLSVIAHARGRQAELVDSSREARRQCCDHFRPGFDELLPQRRDLLRPRSDRIAGRIASGCTA